ncbi:hypothetical protein K458DRAFT_395762 [Lentithecium fluviatile CBS 122367]|uniref:Uncharacterized protein n=1 Tax=Lentithecium fluviatile CBS 122367 TaxID=1168545 RepID=A0A6G1IHI0_9PLEO|nr:hypothetical protein K458DRAFT_395762 [Lentithecium fluviatile CBS 122367]
MQPSLAMTAMVNRDESPVSASIEKRVGNSPVAVFANLLVGQLRKERDSEPQGDTEQASSRSLWVISACLAISGTLQAEMGLLEFFPVLTPWLLAFKIYLQRESSDCTCRFWVSSPAVWGATLTAFVIAFALSNGNILSFTLSGAAFAPLFLFYAALLPRAATRGNFLPHIGDFENAVTSLSWRTAAIMVFALGGHTLLYGAAWDREAHVLALGLLKALFWYFVAQTFRNASWCIAPAMISFAVVAVQDLYTTSKATSVVLASILALS